MVGVRFSRIAEQKSNELAHSLVVKLMESPRTATYREIDAESLRKEYRRFFRDLTDWLLYRSQAEIEEMFSLMGRMRARQSVPLEECVNAMLVCRDHLVEFLREETTKGDGVELFGELEFVLAVSHFCDDAIFFCMRGYRGYKLEAEAVA
jgi:hypothetical protein